MLECLKLQQGSSPYSAIHMVFPEPETQKVSQDVSIDLFDSRLSEKYIIDYVVFSNYRLDISLSGCPEKVREELQIDE